MKLSHRTDRTFTGMRASISSLRQDLVPVLDNLAAMRKIDKHFDFRLTGAMVTAGALFHISAKISKMPLPDVSHWLIGAALGIAKLVEFSSPDAFSTIPQNMQSQYRNAVRTWDILHENKIRSWKIQHQKQASLFHNDLPSHSFPRIENQPVYSKQSVATL